MRAPITLLLTASLLTVAACASKKKDLPPPPPATSVTTTTDTSTGAPVPMPATGATPGSAADFAAQSGSDRVLFVYDSYDVDTPGRATLDKQASWLRKYPRVKVTLEGHCDERGTREYNLALGDRRANAAKNYLAAQGIDVGRITTISYGKERPAVPGSDEESYAQNRRAVTVIVSGAVG